MIKGKPEIDGVTDIQFITDAMNYLAGLNRIEKADVDDGIAQVARNLTSLRYDLSDILMDLAPKGMTFTYDHREDIYTYIPKIDENDIKL